MSHIWTEEDDRFLEAHYGTMSRECLARHFETTPQAIAQHCYKRGITTKRYFSEEEEEFILDNFGSMTAERISKALGRDIHSVRCKISRMGLGKYFENSESLHLAEVARMVNRNKETLKKIWIKRGLKITKKGKYSMISQDNLADVMRKNPDLYDATECDDYFRFYGWFNEKLMQDRKNKYDKGA